MTRTSARPTASTAPQSVLPIRAGTTCPVRLEGETLVIEHHFQTSDGTPFRRFDLNELWLPPSPLNASPLPLKDRPALVAAAVHSVQALASRLSPSKSGATQFGFALKTIIKFFEYGWLRGLYDLSDWTQHDANALLIDLGKGGWARALKIRERTEAFLQSAVDEDLSRYVSSSKNNRSSGFCLRDSFGARIGTNCQHSELTGAKELLLAHLKLSASAKQGVHSRKKRSEVSGMGQSQLRQELRFINLLCEHLQPGTGLNFVPYPDTVKLSHQYGRAPGRTGNLAPDTVAALLKESLWWVTEVSGPAIGLLDHLYAAVTPVAKSSAERRTGALVKALHSSHHSERLGELLGVSISTLGLRGGVKNSSVKQVLYNLTTACFIVIAFLNARRKDEVQHRAIGLHRNSLRVVDRRLGLYECEFYIEKTFKDYVTFYVGKQTCAAIRVLEHLSDIARDFEAVFRNQTHSLSSKHKVEKLFQIPRILGTGKGSGSQWFQFNAGPDGISYDLVRRALGDDSTLHVHVHMFRRAYALIFHYRYENRSLLALAQQLGHWDLETALLYVTDAPDGPVSSTTAASYARKTTPAEARAARQKEIEEEIREVGRDRVFEVAQQVVDGRADAVGGFARLVRRFHQRLGRRLDYQAMDSERKANVLGEAFVGLGHIFRPMKHANCVASQTRRTQSSACYSHRLERIAPEDASPSRCSRCPYSHITSGHLEVWRSEADKLAEQARSTHTVAGRQAQIQLGNVRRVIELMSSRVGM